MNISKDDTSVRLSITLLYLVKTAKLIVEFLSLSFGLFQTKPRSESPTSRGYKNRE